MITIGSVSNFPCHILFMRPKRRNLSKGFALVYALIIITVVAILLTSIIGFVVQNMKFSSNRVAREEAFQIAEAGVYSYRWYLAHETSGKNAQWLKTFWQNPATLGVSGPVETDYTDPGTGTVIGHYSLVLDPPDPSSTIATITSTGTLAGGAGGSRTIRVRFRRPSWSEYAMLTDSFAWFGDTETVWGKVHSNKGVRVDGVAHNSVTSLVPTISDHSSEGHGGGPEFGVHTHKNVGGGVNYSFNPDEAPPINPVPPRPDVFEGGRQFPVPEISFTGALSDLAYMKKIACGDSGSGCTVVNTCGTLGCYFDNTGVGRQIILKTNGTFDMCTVNTFSVNTTPLGVYDVGTNAMTGFAGKTAGGVACTAPTTSSGPDTQCTGDGTCFCECSNYPIPPDGIIFVDNNAWLEGTLPAGVSRFTVVAGTGTMYLGNNNLLYTEHNGNNILGVIGQQDVEVIRNSPDTLELDGALLAQNGQVGRRYYGAVDDKTKIVTNGAIATKNQWTYSYVYNNGTFASGYRNTQLYFDNNLLYYPPPYFPTGTEYSIDLWEEL